MVPPRTVVGDCYKVTKRTLDLVFAVTAAIMLLPLMLAIALAIKLTSPGPVLFRQVRAGRGDTTFKLYKFRTMREAACDPSGVEQTKAGDPRLTTIGGWLRRTSLDELPQLLNIIKGDMSFVGPRPHVPGQLAAGMPYSRLVPYYELRHTIRPGLTGWAQANGFRGPTHEATAARERIDHDLAYVQHCSLWLDFRIVALTARYEFLSGNGS